MLGRHHISITIASILPFLIPIIFNGNADLTQVNLNLPLVFFIAAFIGSLTPDSDCGGKASIHYKFPLVDWIMKNIIVKSIVFIFQIFVSKKYNLDYEVKEEHRGIMHSPIGVLFSSFVLTVFFLIASLLIDMFNIWAVFLVFAGMLIGQLLHLLEDSCTVSGINWKFPFGKKEINGQIYTFQKIEDKKDVRPSIFQYTLLSFSLILVILYHFNKLTLSLWLLYLVISGVVLLVWLLILFLSKSKSEIWYVKTETLKKIKKQVRNIGK